MIELRADFADHFRGRDAFREILELQGEVYRELKNRKTFRIEVGGKGYFVKSHGGVGLGEIFKNLLQFKLPVVGAGSELRAVRRLEELGIATMKVAAYGVRGIPPAWLRSFIITDELENTASLEDLTLNWKSKPPQYALKSALIRKTAGIASVLHKNGVNHRDFYICHFFIDRAGLTGDYKDLRVYLIDLHRVQIREKTPQRWVVKDLAGLFFSAMDIGIVQRDLFRFMKQYSGKPLREILKEEGAFWQKVKKRAEKLYMKHHGRIPAD